MVQMRWHQDGPGESKAPRGAQRTLFCPSWLVSPSAPPPQLSVLHCMNLVGSSGCMFGPGIRSCHTHLDLLSAEVGHAEGEGLGLLPGALKGPQVEVVLGAISQSVLYPERLWVAPCTPPKKKTRMTKFGTNDSESGAPPPGLGCGTGPPSFTCRLPCCQDGPELLLISHGTLCHHTTESHVWTAQDAHCLRCVPLLDGLVDGSKAQGHCGETGGCSWAGSHGSQGSGGRASEHLPISHLPPNGCSSPASPSAPSLPEGTPSLTLLCGLAI